MDINMNDNWESQREAMYNGWKNGKTFLTPDKQVSEDHIKLSVEYDGKIYEQKSYYKDMFGSADPYVIAFNRLQIELKEVNKNIELNFGIE